MLKWSVRRCSLIASFFRKFSSRPAPTKKHVRLNLELQNASSLGKVDIIVRQNRQSLNDVCISSALQTLAKLRYKKDDKVKIEDCMKILTQMLMFPVKADIYWPTALANAIWALSRLGLEDEEVWSVLVGKIPNCLDELKTHCLTVLVYSLPNIPPLSVQLPLWIELAKRVTTRLQEFDSNEVLGILTATTKLCEPLPNFTNLLLQHLEKKGWSNLTDHQLGQVLNAVGVLKVQTTQRMLNNLLCEVETRLDRLSLQGAWLGPTAFGIARIAARSADPVKLRVIMNRVFNKVVTVNDSKDLFLLCSAFAEPSIYTAAEALENIEELYKYIPRGDSFERVKDWYSIMLQACTLVGEEDRRIETLKAIGRDKIFGKKERRHINELLQDLLGYTPSYDQNWKDRNDHLEAIFLSRLLGALRNPKHGATNMPWRERTKFVISYTEEFGRKECFLKIAGETKIQVLESLIHRYRPSWVLEFGSYFGYSAHKLSAAMYDAGVPVPQVYTVEADPLNAIYCQVLANATGAPITVFNAQSSQIIPRLKQLLPVTGTIEQPAMIFLDYRGPIYHADLQALEIAGFVKKGTLVVANNCLCPGAPQYVDYMLRNGGNPNYETEIIETPEAFQSRRNWILVSSCVETRFDEQHLPHKGEFIRTRDFEWMGKKIDRISRSPQKRNSSDLWEEEWSFLMRRFYEHHGVHKT